MNAPPNRLLRIGFFAAAAVVGALSLAPNIALPSLSLGDKVEHVVAYAGLGFLGTAADRERSGALCTILGLLAFGLALESLQAFSPGRSAEIGDALANIAGTCLGGGGAIMLRRTTVVLSGRGR